VLSVNASERSLTATSRPSFSTGVLARPRSYLAPLRPGRGLGSKASRCTARESEFARGKRESQLISCVGLSQARTSHREDHAFDRDFLLRITDAQSGHAEAIEREEIGLPSLLPQGETVDESAPFDIDATTVSPRASTE